MWHDTMLATCRPVWDFSPSFVTLYVQTSGSLKWRYCFQPKLKPKRVCVAPGIIHGGNSCGVWRNGELCQLNHQRSFKSQTMSSYNWQGVAVSTSPQGSRPVVGLRGSSSSSLAVTMTAVVTTDVDVCGLTNGEARMQVYSLAPSREQEINVAETEKLRRHRISIANKGKIPWNKGGKHSAETIKRIKEKTSQAMQSPTVRTDGTAISVMAKLRLNARHPQTNETRVKIRDKLRHRWDTKKRIRGYQEIMLKDWNNYVAEAARTGGLGEEEMQWTSYGILKKKLRLDAAAQSRSEKLEKKATAKATRALKSEEHRLKISAAIKAKWEDPEYQLKVKRGMIKHSNATKGVHKAQRRKCSGQNVTSEGGCIKGPLDHGFITAVMSGEKKRQRKEDTEKEQKHERSAVSIEQAQTRARNRKVDLLKGFAIPAQSEEESFEDDFTRERSVAAEHSFVDPQAGEKLFRLMALHASRMVMDQRRREATHRAKVLMAEVKQATKNLEVTADSNEFSQASLVEIYRLVAEAEHFIQAADSVHKDIDSTKFHGGGLWTSRTAQYHLSIFQQQIASQREHGRPSPQGQVIENILSTNSYGHDMSKQSGQDIIQGMKATTTVPDSSQIRIPGNSMRDEAVWNVHNSFMDELQCRRGSIWNISPI